MRRQQCAPGHGATGAPSGHFFLGRQRVLGTGRWERSTEPCWRDGRALRLRSPGLWHGGGTASSLRLGLGGERRCGVRREAEG